jgi:2-methylcitrate dehydratase PrpD
MLGGTLGQIANAVSLAFFEPSLSLHRFGSNTGPRKGWAGGDATADAVRFAFMAVQGEPGYPQVLSHKDWGFEKSFLGGNALRMGEPREGVIQGVLYKFHPAVIHVQSAVECAIRLHPRVAGRLDDIASITLETHREVMAKVSKTGPLRNAADRDHCLQYSVAVALLKGGLVAHDYEDEAAADPRIDRLRALMQAGENPEFTRRYLDPASGANPNAIEVKFRDGTSTGRVEINQPAGHPRRREEGLPMLVEKFRRAVRGRFPSERAEGIVGLCMDHERLVRMPVDGFMELMAM